MLSEEEKDQASGKSWRTFSRSVSWTERRKTSINPQWNSKARACLPPLQPLSIIRPSIEDWPKAGSDDLGIWPNSPTPGARPRSMTPRGNSTSDREFECRKDKLAYFDKECSRIVDHIYLGSDAIAKDRETLRQNGITHVLNCVGFVCPEYFKNELIYKTLWLQDCPSEDITSILYDVFDYFEDVREQGGRVFVHCCHGVSRSTSLVIAYLMWKKGQSFDDAFEFVKKARGVTNPNVGFACQLLQCQKRVHAQPASPSSILRMYRMAPHSPYDPLHLVPKSLCEPGPDKLDSRGSFIIHVPSGLYVWIGKHCSSVMSENAISAASQVVRYEKAQGPIITVKEGEETFGFWDAFNYKKGLAVNPCVGQRKQLDEYDLDFKIFHRALTGGVVPPFPLSEAGPETCLPARDNGWNRFRKKYVDGILKEFIASSKLDSGALQIRDSPCNSPDSFASCVTSSPGWAKNSLKEVVDSFSSFSVSNNNKPHSNSTSPSVSPSTSDYSSSFTSSPSSSNWSDLSFVSAQSSPYVADSRDADIGKSRTLEKNDGSVDESTCLLNNVTSSPAREKAIFAWRVSRAAGLCSLTSAATSPSLAERRGVILLPSIDEASQVSENLTRFLEDDVIKCRLRDEKKLTRKSIVSIARPKPSHAEPSETPSFKLAYSPKRATAELRHSSSIGSRSTPSPSAAAVAPSPLSSDHHSTAAADDDDNGRDRYPRDRSFRSYFQPFVPHYFSPNDDLYRPHPHRSKISIIIFVAVVFAAVISVSSVVKRLNAPYLCKKDGITLHCPHVKETPSLWENPYSATTSWKPCAERREGIISDIPAENETNGYIFIHAEGGLNQQRIAICNAVAVAKILNATLILPVLKQDQIWKDQTKFEDIFDVDHFIDYLKDDVRIVRDIPEWFTDKAELFTSIRRTVKNIPKYAPAQFYRDNVLPRIKEKKIMALKPFVDRLGYDNVPQEINRLRCRVNYHALKFLPEIENMADLLVSRMRNRTGSSNPFMALHLRFEKGMVGLSFCDFVGSRMEKALMALYRLKEWPRRFKDGSHLWPLALQKRKEGRCPLEPGEVAVMLRGMGYPKETQIYVASGQVYGGQNRMAPLRNMFPNLVTKEELATKLELDGFRKHVTSLAALDFLVCLKSDVFVMTHGGNFAKLIIGNRRYMGHRQKSIKPDKGLMSKSLGDPYMGWATFVEDVVATHETRTGLPEATFPNYDIWENPLTPCMCRT